MPNASRCNDFDNHSSICTHVIAVILLGIEGRTVKIVPAASHDSNWPCLYLNHYESPEALEETISVQLVKRGWLSQYYESCDVDGDAKAIPPGSDIHTQKVTSKWN